MQKQSPSSRNCSLPAKIRATWSSEDCQVPPASYLLVLAGDSSIRYPPNVYVSTHLCICQPSLLQGTDWSPGIQEGLSLPGYSFCDSSEIFVPKSPSLLGLAQFLDWMGCSTSLLHWVSLEYSTGVWLRTKTKAAFALFGIWKS